MNKLPWRSDTVLSFSAGPTERPWKLTKKSDQLKSIIKLGSSNWSLNFFKANCQRNCYTNNKENSCWLLYWFQFSNHFALERKVGFVCQMIGWVELTIALHMVWCDVSICSASSSLTGCHVSGDADPVNQLPLQTVRLAPVVVRNCHGIRNFR